MVLQVLRIAQYAGMVKMEHVSLDGAKMRANASKHKAMSYGRMKQEEQRLRQEVSELIQQTERTWGCSRISALLKLEGRYVSPPTVQSILNKHDMGSKYERLLRLEERASEKAIELTPVQVAIIMTKERNPQTNGFVERFNRTVLHEFFRIAFRQKFDETVEELQTDLDAWLIHYNTERPHRGYRNMGKRPIDTINDYLKSPQDQSGETVRLDD
jgi:hypothetical protein